MVENAANCILLFIILNTYTHTLSFIQNDTTIFVYVRHCKIRILTEIVLLLRNFRGLIPEIANSMRRVAEVLGMQEIVSQRKLRLHHCDNYRALIIG